MYSNLDIVAYLKFLRKFYLYWQRRVNLYLGEDLRNYPKISSCKLNNIFELLFYPKNLHGFYTVLCDVFMFFFSCKVTLKGTCQFNYIVKYYIKQFRCYNE